MSFTLNTLHRNRNKLNNFLKMKIKLIKSVLLLLAIVSISSCSVKEEKVLVFSKTAGFRHGSIEAGIKAVKKLGAENGFMVDATEDSTFFTEEILSKYNTVIFMNTTLDILDAAQQSEFGLEHGNEKCNILN